MDTTALEKETRKENFQAVRNFGLQNTSDDATLLRKSDKFVLPNDRLLSFL